MNEGGRLRRFLQEQRHTLAFLLCLILAGVGITLGIAATSSPHVANGGLFERVSVWTDRRESRVELIWSMDVSGRVMMTVTTVADGETLVAVVLTCGARLSDLDDSSGYEVLSWGHDAACDRSLPSSDEVASQAILAWLTNTERLRVIADPVRSWVDDAAGVRVARTPQIVMGASPPGLERLARNNLGPVSTDSVVQIELSATASEVIETAVPTSGDALSLSTSAAASMVSPEIVPVSIAWQYEGSGATSSLARWRDADASGRAQLQILWSGVLLGLAVSLAAEVLFVRLRVHETG